MDSKLASVLGKNDAVPQLGLRLREAARAIGISKRSLWGMAKSGQILHFRIGRALLFPVAELEKWIADRTSQAREVRP